MPLIGSVFLQGLTLSLGLIVAIGAQNAFVLRQGLRREHVTSVVLFCALSDALLIAAGVLVFIFSLGFYITPAILGGGKTLMVAEWIGLQILDLIRWGLGTMMATVLVVAILATLAIFSRVVDLRRVFGSGA